MGSRTLTAQRAQEIRSLAERPAESPPEHATCETYPGWSEVQCGSPAAGRVWVQCVDDGPRERGVCSEHLAMLEAGASFRCRYCSSDLNLLHLHG
jgi:hypothetical protein